MKLRVAFGSALLAVLTSASGGEIAVLPECPGPSVVVSVGVKQSPVPPAFLPDDALVTAQGNDFRILLNAVQAGAPGMPSSTRRVALGQLPEGSYQAAVYYRYELLSGTYLPEQLFGSVRFDVRARAETDGPCPPGVITIESGGFQRTAVGRAFAEPIAVEVDDGQLRPVSNVQVRLERVLRPEDPSLTSDQQPGATQNVLLASTDAHGMAKFNVTANAASGTYQYKATIGGAAFSPEAYAVLDNREPASQSDLPLLPVVEFYNAARNHYFITQDVAEAQRLDLGLAQGWRRTGAVFLAMPAGSAVAKSQPVCRFYGLPEAGLDSHFFSVSPVECARVIEQFGSSWALETAEAFREFLPDVATGACAAGTVPLYRAWNNRVDANHRYTLSKWVIASMVSRTWIPEGYGSSAVAMCVPH